MVKEGAPIGCPFKRNDRRGLEAGEARDRYGQHPARQGGVEIGNDSARNTGTAGAPPLWMIRRIGGAPRIIPLKRIGKNHSAGVVAELRIVRSDSFNDVGRSRV